jgi:hypothetical protein
MHGRRTAGGSELMASYQDKLRHDRASRDALVRRGMKRARELRSAYLREMFVVKMGRIGVVLVALGVLARRELLRVRRWL